MATVQRKTTEIVRFEYDDPAMERVREVAYRSEQVEYDPQGKPVIEVSWDESGNLNERYRREFDASGRLIAERLEQEEGELAEERTLSYDEEGRLLKEVIIYQDGSVSEIAHSWDAEGNRTAIVCTDEDGEEEYHERFLYEQGRRVGQERREYGELQWQRSWAYDEAGRQMSFSEVDAADGRQVVRELEYDARGRVVSEKTRANGRLTTIRRQEYDAHDHVIAVEIESETGYERVVFSFDEAGNEVSQEVFGRDGQRRSMVRREYDAQGNLLESEVSAVDPGTGVERRYLVRNIYTWYGE